MDREIIPVLGPGFRAYKGLKYEQPETRHADGYAHLTDCNAINTKPETTQRIFFGFRKEDRHPVRMSLLVLLEACWLVQIEAGCSRLHRRRQNLRRLLRAR